ncbi:MAG: cysteine--tRNA ligase [bacterium]|nr:cysteine--tRNA ligase [bacterium]
MKLYNTLTGNIEELIPFEEKNIRMYVCGITPYDTTHLGHAFLYTFFDALNRYLRYKGYNVTYVQNVTDIDDDILKRAKLQNRDWKELGQFWTDKFVNDLKALNILMPEHYVKATDSIQTIIKMTNGLVNNGFAYEVDGTIFFRVRKFPEYGKLSTFTPDEMLVLSRERGANPEDPRKEYGLDFILWQKSIEGEPGWSSPWGQGRPGWHIECSAMVQQYLGQQIDIHGGGRDLVYPHHEGEIAQSESFNQKKPYVKTWMHAAMLMYQGEKMSKSLGNLIMVSDLLKSYSPDVIRWVLLSHHYRTPWEFFARELDEAQKSVDKITGVISTAGTTEDKSLVTKFKELMDNDMQAEKVLELLKDSPSKEIFTTLGFTVG